jgi:cytochrome oxidase Cu insertion factor (SCO1/SenC/PrrC family)
MLKKILIGVGAVVVALAILVVAGLYVYPKAQIASATQQAAPDFILKDATGKDFNLASQRGHKVVLYFYRGYW